MITEKTTELYIDSTIELTEELTDFTTELNIDSSTEILTEKLTDFTTEINIDFSSTEILTEKLQDFTEINTNEISERKTPEISVAESSVLITEASDINGDSKKNENNCKNTEIINNKCKNKSITDEQIKELYNQIKEHYIKTFYNGNNTIIKTQNVVFQISYLEDQLYSDNTDTSNVDLGKCEDLLKKQNGIKEEESLIIYKIDIKTADLTQTYVQYEIYDPRDLKRLDLSVCKDITINIYSPIILNNSTSSLYDNLKESGYDLFNKNDSFYNDICAIYTTENGTDIIIEDRKNIIYANNGNMTLCQNDCKYEYYNSTIKKVNCNCIPQVTGIQVESNFTFDKFNSTILTDSFIKTL